MNCPTTDKLSQYVDHLLTEQEQVDILTHLKSCHDCSRKIEAFKEEDRFIKETLQTPTLPDDFASLILDQIEPYDQINVRKKKNPFKRMMYIAAGVVLAIGLGTTLHPSFADWIGGLFSTDQVDEGLRIASDAGLAERVNREATDQGITLKVEDVVADSSRVALSYQILNEKGKLQNSYIELDDSKNDITAINENGKPIDGVSIDWSKASDYGLVEFSLREQKELKKIIVKFNLVELNGIKGHWNLEIPVDLKESLKQTTTLSLNDVGTSTHGVAVKMKEVRFAPSSNELLYETSFTKEEQSSMEGKIQKLKEQFGEENVNTFTNYGTAIQYHLENKEMKTVYYHNTFVKGKGHPVDSGVLQGTGHPLEQFGQAAWNESFIPQKDEKNLTFVLDGVIKTVPSQFSIKIKPKELKEHPVSFEYEGNFMTIKKAEKQNKFSLRRSLIPFKRETIYKIEMEGVKKATASNLGVWVLEDDKGEIYSTYGGGSILDEKDEKGRYKTTIDLFSYDLNENPKELTLHLISETRYFEINDKWKVPLY